MTTSPFGPVMVAEALPDLKAGLGTLSQEGWTQGSYRDETGAFCSLGALDYYANRRFGELNYSAVRVLAQAIRNSGWAPVPDNHDEGVPFAEWSASAVVGRWNDEDGRTWPEVQTMWETAIKTAETFSPHSTVNVVPTGKLDPTANQG